MSALQISEVTEPARQDAVLSVLESIVTDLIGIDALQMDRQATFLDMGADSLSLLQASQAIQDRLGVKIPFRLLFEELSTIEAVAAHINAEVAPDQPAAFKQAAAELSQSKAQEGQVEQPTFAQAIDFRPVVEQVESHAPANSLERVIAYQLQLMSEQLSLLSNGHSKNRSAPSLQTAPQAEVATVAQHAREQDASADSIIDADPYVAYKPIEKKATPSGLTHDQRAHLDALIERLARRTAGSKRLAQQYRRRLADSSASSGFRSLWKELCYPISVERAKGSRVWDVDGNEYVDITMGFGSLFFGHSPAFIIEAMEEQFSRGLQIGWKTEVAGKVAELVCEMTGAERVAFCNSGTEAVMSALRLARAVTGRTKIAVFAGSFHGTFDGVLIKGEKNADGTLRAVPMAPGVPRHMVEQVIVLNYGDPRSLEIIKEHVEELAAVLVEPCPSRRPDLQAKDFLKALRRVTEEGGAALIFDEVITGFRMHPGGAQALFDVRADIITYGKAIGSGFPIAAVAGKAAFLDAVDGGMWNYGDSSSPRADTTYYAGTFFKHPVGMSAAYAALTKMKESGPALQQQLNERTTKFVESLNAYFEQMQAPIRMGNFGSLFRFFFPKRLKHTDLFYFHLIEKGVWVSETRVCFVSTSTTDDDLAYVADAVKESIVELQQGGFIPSLLPDDGRHSPRHFQQQAETIAGKRTAPMTEAQRGLWVLAQMGDEISSAYNESMIVRLRGPLNVCAMRNAIENVINRHEALRTTFSDEGDLQIIAPAINVDVPLVDLSEGVAEGAKERVTGWLTNEVKQPFDMLEGPLFRARIAKLEEQEHLLVLVIHHIAIDAWSFDRLLGEINALYSAKCQNVACELSQPMPYSEYARLKSSQEQSKEDATNEQYWLSRFEGKIAPLELPTDRPRPQLQTYNGARQRMRVATSLYRELKEISARRGCTLFMTLLSGFKVLLHHLTGQDDIVVGSHSAGQANFGGANLIGFCINMLPLRSRLSGDPTFEDYSRSVKRNVLDAYRHQDYPISRLIKKLKLVRDPSRPPLASVVFNMDWAMSVERLTSGLKCAGLEMELVEGPVVFARFDLLWNLVDVGTELVLDCTYNTDLFDAQTIRGWMESYEALLEMVVSRPGIKVAALGEILTQANAGSESWKE